MTKDSRSLFTQKMNDFLNNIYDFAPDPFKFHEKF